MPAYDHSCRPATMFTPSQNDVRHFFCETYRKLTHHIPLTPMEALAAQWVEQHPEYHADLADENAALAAVFTVEEGRVNPFLHLSMHLSITEQVSIDQPIGIRDAAEKLSQKLGSLHEAHHEIMECLGKMIWESQRSGLPPDGHSYIDCVRQRATRHP